MYIPGIVIIIVITVVLSALAFLIFLQKKLRKEREMNSDYRNQLAELKNRHAEEIFNLERERYREKTDEYNRGYKEGFEKSKLSISILPWKDTETKNSFFSKRHKISIGYQYQFFYGEIPIHTPQTVIVEKIDTADSQDQNIKYAIDKIATVTEQLGRIIRIIPNPAASLIDFAQSIKSLLK